MAALANFAQRFAAFTLRERVLAVLAVLAVLFMLLDYTWYTPANTRLKALRESVKTQAAQETALTNALRQVASQPQSDSTASQRAEVEALRTQANEADTLLQKVSADIRVGDVLRSIAGGTPGVTLVALRTIPSKNFYAPPAIPKVEAASSASGSASAAAAVPRTKPIGAIYQHGVEVTIKGPYPAVASYLRAVEQAGRGVFWGDLQLDAQYPDSTVKFSLFVLSTQPEMLFE